MTDKTEKMPYDSMQPIESLVIESKDISEQKVFLLEIIINDLPPLREYLQKPLTIAEFACHLEGYAQLLKKGPP